MNASFELEEANENIAIGFSLKLEQKRNLFLSYFEFRLVISAFVFVFESDLSSIF